MSLFHWVAVPGVVRCPNCGRKLDSFQSKDESQFPCQCETIPLSAVTNLYTECYRSLWRGCGAWIELDRRADRPGTSVSDFAISWTLPEQD